MVDENLVGAQLKGIRARLGQVSSYTTQELDDLEPGTRNFDALAFSLVLMIQGCLDIASHLIADENWRSAGSYGESFRILAENGVISKEIAKQLADAAKMRNLLVHLYSRVSPEEIARVVREDLGDIELFMTQVSDWMLGRLSD